MNEPGEIFLTSREMAQFVSSELMRFDAVVPANLNEAAVPLFAAGLEPVLRDSHCRHIPARRSDRQPARLRIHGAISSLVGPEPIKPHHRTRATWRAERAAPAQRRMIDRRRTTSTCTHVLPASGAARKGATL
jgi:hypothetical protein